MDLIFFTAQYSVKTSDEVAHSLVRSIRALVFPDFPAITFSVLSFYPKVISMEWICKSCLIFLPVM